jgi:pilus assembly protein CpaC
MRTSSLFAWMVLALALPFSAWAQEGGTIELGIGRQTVITIPGIVRVALGNPSIAEVKPIGNTQLLIIGTAEGKSSLLVWKNNGTRVSYTISVQAIDKTTLISEMKKLLGEIEGVTIRSIGDRVILDGQAYTQADSDRIDQVVALYQAQNVKSFVKIAPNAKKLVSQNLNAAFQKAGLRNVQASVVGATIFLEGSVESQQDLQKAELITKAIGEKVESLLVVGIKRMILTEVQFVEIRRGGKDRYGIKFPTDIGGSMNASMQISKELFPGNFAEGSGSMGASGTSSWYMGFQNNDGYGRLLAQPKLVCASGEKAEFVAGGQVPIPMVTANGFSVDYKPYGTILKITPTADRSGNIQTEIEAEVSEVDMSVSVTAGAGGSVPGFRTRKAKTNVTVKHGETIVLSGLFSHDEQKAVSKLPGLGHIPILGELFKNRSFDSTKLELVMFVTPRIVNPDSDKIRTIIEDVKSRYKQARSEVSFGIFD